MATAKINFSRAFGTDLNIEQDIWFQFRDGEFLCEGNGRRFVAYGEYNAENDTHTVEHGPTQHDVDVIAGLLYRGLRPTVWVNGGWQD